MLDPQNETDAEALEELRNFARTGQGLNFALAMRNPDGKVKVYRRQNQPCQGGEMRKYYDTHGDLCTRPGDRRPGDLEHPFPPGVVEAVSVHFSAERDSLLRAAFSNDSPWLRGFGSPDNIELVKTKSKKVVGIILLDTEIDPTVFVNLLQFCRVSRVNWDRYKGLSGFSVREKLILAGWFNNHSDVSSGVFETYQYYFSQKPSLRRLFESDPVDLSGGTYKAGFDYNRPDISKLFSGDDGINLVEELYRRGMPKPYLKSVIGYRYSDNKVVDGKDYLPIKKYYENPSLYMGHLDFHRAVLSEPPENYVAPSLGVFCKIVREIFDEYLATRNQADD